MKSLVKKAILIVLTGSVLVATTGCNEKDVVTGVIIGGIIGGIAAGGNITIGTHEPGYSYLSDCEGYNRDWICEWTYSAWRRVQLRPRDPQPPRYNPPYNPGRPPLRPGGNFHESLAINLQSDSDVEDSAVDLKAIEIANRWSLSSSASLKLSQAIENAKGGDMNAFNKVGLDIAILSQLLNEKKIDINDLTNFTDKLETNEDTAKDILNAFLNEYQHQKRDVSGALWKQCQSTGQWKTPEASSCSSLEAIGCAPETGASNCLPL
jgi:hypothetical protein